jgi:hypothetical protein
MSPDPTHPLGDRFAYFVALARGMIARHMGPGRLSALIPVLTLIYQHLGRAERRFIRLLAHYRAGTLRPPIKRAQKPRAPRTPTVYPHPADAWRMLRLPSARAWLPRHIQETTTGKLQLELMMAEPAFAELMAAAPQLARLFRPLCRIFGVEEMPPAVRPLPRKPRKPRPKPTPAPALPPLRWRGYEIPKGRKKPPGYPKRRLLPFE